MARFQSLRWRLTAFYLGLLAVLLLVGGFAQYFAAREVLFRTNAQVLTSEYAAVLTAFRKQNVNRPAAALRALILSNQFSLQLASRHTSAAIFDLNGGRVAQAPATLSSTEDVPTLRAQEYADEIGKLAVAFNQMAAGIDQAFEVRRQSEEEMRHFVADASHELRTPLTSIAGYIDVLGRRQNVDSETLHESLRAMQQESSRMTR